ncbi:hypothetical protein NKJ09_28390 [Mesorhizobium sp. M0189]|uniref:hypothetical protein n=1 Tax=Mesorhizobium sp. M0189 TaxID=2956909 RepID=UPI003338D127
MTPLRELTADPKEAKLVGPRPTVRSKLNWIVGPGLSKVGMSYGLFWGIGAATEVVELEDGRSDRRYLDCGENPPDGAIIYYWLPNDLQGPVKLTFRDAANKTIIFFSSDDKDVPFHKKLGTKAGLHRFVWDLRHPGPAKLDQFLVTRKYKPLAAGGGRSERPDRVSWQLQS